MLYIFSGLPGAGKTTLSQMLTQHLAAVYLRIDTIEQSLRDLCAVKVEGEGYRLAYRVASDNLILGNSVVADSCNPIHLTRQEWAEIAKRSHSGYTNIEITCSDLEEHKIRIESRQSTIKNLQQPSWDDVQTRAYDVWEGEDCIVVDTAHKTIDNSFEELLLSLGLDKISNKW